MKSNPDRPIPKANTGSAILNWLADTSTALVHLERRFDPLFRPATLPDGWQRKASDHAMGSHIADALGRQRVTVFYKAAFYDRKAHMSLVSLDWYVTCSVEYDGGPVILDGEWATREAVAAVMERQRDQLLAEAAEFRGFAAGDNPRRDAANRAGCAEIAGQKTATAQKYADALAAMASQETTAP